MWIKRSPLVSLLSVAGFSVGFVLFAYSSQQTYSLCISPSVHLVYFQPQSSAVATATTVFTPLSSFGLVAVSAWFASERWVYSRHKGKGGCKIHSTTGGTQ